MATRHSHSFWNELQSLAWVPGMRYFISVCAHGFSLTQRGSFVKVTPILLASIYQSNTGIGPWVGTSFPRSILKSKVAHLTKPYGKAELCAALTKVECACTE